MIPPRLLGRNLQQAQTDATRETILDALFERVRSVQFSSQVQGTLQWRTSSRRLRLFDAVPAGEQPAVFQVEHEETYEQPNIGTPPVRTLNVSLFCYAQAPSGGTVGGSLLNYMLAGIESALAADNPSTGLCTLGGQVYQCVIKGRLLKDPGDIDDQAMLIVPLQIMWP